MLWSGRRAPVTLIGGYLGSGKTTVLNHLIRHADGRRLVVLVNDIGAVNVDAALVAEHDGDTMTLTNGCVCCSITDDLGLTLESIRQMPEPPDHVVMELSGVAEPARVAPWASTAGLRLDGIVVTADAEQLVAQLGRDDVGDAVAAQVRSADLVLLTKPDLDPDNGSTAVTAIGQLSAAPVITTVHGVVDPEVLLGVDREGPAPAPRSDDDAHHRYVVETHSVAALTEAELRQLVDDLPDDVVRAKGIVAGTDVEGALEVHVVGTRRIVRRRPDLIDAVSAELVVIRLPES